MAGLIATTSVGLALSVAVAVNLARRILVPLNSVTDSIRRVARGDLDARAVAGDRSLHEAALLADHFNALADELQRVTNEQAIWNAAIAHELRTPVTVLRGRCRLAEGVFKPDEAQFRSLLTQVEGLTRLIEDLRVVSLADGGHLSIEIRDADLAADVRAVVDVFAHALQAAGQHPVLDLDTRRMRCDPVRIRQAARAAGKRTPPRGARHDPDPDADRSRDVPAARRGRRPRHPGRFRAACVQGVSARRRVAARRQRLAAVVAAIAHAHHGEAVCVPTGAGGTRFEVQWPDNLVPAPDNARFPA